MSVSRVRYLSSRAREIVRQRGPVGLLRRSSLYVYLHHVRPLLPAGEYPEFNGVVVGSEDHRPHLFDDVVPVSTPADPDWDVPPERYKHLNVDLLRETVRPGDDVVVVGGGFGVTTVAAAEAAGPSGSVTAYEASDKRSRVLERTVELNSVDNVTVRQAIVGTAVDVEGQATGATVVDPAALSAADVLEMDCEGAELDILRALDPGPRRVVVETHPDRDAPTELVVRELESMGYQIAEKRPDPGSGGILVAVRST